jgi:hypothetical protein
MMASNREHASKVLPSIRHGFRLQGLPRGYRPADVRFPRGSSSRVVKLRDTSFPDHAGNSTAACPSAWGMGGGRWRVTGMVAQSAHGLQIWFRT